MVINVEKERTQQPGIVLLANSAVPKTGETGAATVYDLTSIKRQEISFMKLAIARSFYLGTKRNVEVTQ